MIYLQSRNRDIVVEKKCNKCMDTKGEEEGGGTGKLGLAYIYYC